MVIWSELCYIGITMRKMPLAKGEVYHVYTRSIANYQIFNNESEFERMRRLIKYYKINTDVRLSSFLDLIWVQKEGFNNAFMALSKDKENNVQIIAYCLMPTHIHLVLKQLVEDGISDYMGNILNGFTRFFNTTRKRKGPLWESRFKSALVKNNVQLKHLVRYIHLNPTTAYLVTRPEDWLYSSYREYLGKINASQGICQFNDILDIKPLLYRKFVNDQIAYQRELAKIKELILES